MRTVLLALALIVAAARPAAASPLASDDRTAALLAELDRCAPQVGQPLRPLPFDVLLALADGRSAREFATLATHHGCVSYVQAIGEGEAEIALVSTVYAPGSPNGAILWVDHGWWRIARVPTGYTTTVVSEQSIGNDREIFFAVGSGGSAGDVGAVGVRIGGANAAVILDAPAVASHLGALLLDPDHLLVTGRKLGPRPFAWPSNCCLPSSHEWLYARRGRTFALVDERQPLDPYFALSAFVGGASVRDATFMRDVGTDRSIAEALDGLPADPYRTAPPTGVFDLAHQELLSWDAIPAPSRGAPPYGPIYALSYILDARSQRTSDVVFELDRDAGGWRVTALYFEDRVERAPHGPS